MAAFLLMALHIICSCLNEKPVQVIGPRQLTEDEARDTARHTVRTGFRSADIGKAIGRSRQTVDSYVADLRAATQPAWPRHQDIPHAPPRHAAGPDYQEIGPSSDIAP